ncbi:MAG: D-2-hydroxyacid dehydrogenase [Succinatimonas sp.]|nr:D-2-hydroxyacid dehydrogenase [Succinatimonas sp.]
MSKKILVAVDVNAEHLSLFKQISQDKCEFVVKSLSDVNIDDVVSVDGIIGNVDPEIVKHAENLEFLQLNSAGCDQYLKPGILKDKTALCTAVGSYGLTVSEHMLALTFDLVRHFALYRDKQLAHDWSDCGKITSVWGSTIAVLGLGDIGGSYAQKVKALGVKCVIGIRRNIQNKPDYIDELYSFEDLDKILPRADIVAMVLPDSPVTRNLMNKERFNLMKKGAYLINAGRGSAVNQEDLLEAIKSGQIAGAALDVTTPEPLPKDSPLWDEKRIFITPHVAGNFFLQETFERMIKIAASNLQAYLEGGELRNLVRH